MKSATQPGDQEPLEPPLSLFDVAQLLNAMDYRIPAVTQVGLDTWMRSTPGLVEHLREIEQLKIDAVVSDPREAYDTKKYLEQLLAADPRQHPVHILGAVMLEVYGPAIVRLARSQAARAADPSRLEALIQRLEKALGEVGPAGYRAAKLKPPPMLDSQSEAALGKLEHAGLQWGVGFPPGMIADQLAWPADAPLSETELRAKLEELVVEFETVLVQKRSLVERATVLLDTLPDATEREMEAEVPLSVYGCLNIALASFEGVAMEDSLAEVTSALADTPESLRAQWLRRLLTDVRGELTTARADQIWATFIANDASLCLG